MTLQEEFTELVRNIPQLVLYSRAGLAKWLWRKYQNKTRETAFVIVDGDSHAGSLRKVLRDSAFGVNFTETILVDTSKSITITGFIITVGKSPDNVENLKMIYMLDVVIKLVARERKKERARKATESLVADIPVVRAA